MDRRFIKFLLHAGSETSSHKSVQVKVMRRRRVAFVSQPNMTFRGCNTSTDRLERHLIIDKFRDEIPKA